MRIESRTGNFRIDQLIAITGSAEFIEVRYLSNDQWKVMPWVRQWWNNYEGLIKVCCSGYDTMFFKCKDDFWLKTKWAVRKFLVSDGNL